MTDAEDAQGAVGPVHAALRQLGVAQATAQALRSDQLRDFAEALRAADEPAAQAAILKITLSRLSGAEPMLLLSDACGGTGLKGRQGLYEVMFLNPILKKLVMTSADVQQLRDSAIEQGMLTLRMDGWLKVLKGVTTLDQVIRETSA
jgi:type II secretory ATPase GspE/PulE/Tfp pilus assembly ATPase PilB-like protein